MPEESFLRPSIALLHDYADARSEFLAACDRAGAATQSDERPEKGPKGETLAVDWSLFGDPAAPNAVLVVSGTHGVEGIAGSALQRIWLDTCDPAVPEDVCVLVVHAINPYGYAWRRRVDETNVDINRNYFMDSLPQDIGYDEIAELLVPSDWSAESQRRTTSALLERSAAIGIDAFQHVITAGQYTQPEGIFFGGTRPSRSHEWTRAFCREQLARFERLAIIDLHTGLGPWGYGELISSTPRAAASHRRAEQWYGDVRSHVDGDSVSQDLRGECLIQVPEWLPDTEVTPLALEFGTVDSIAVLQALRADAWLHAHGDPTGAEAAPIKQQLLGAFCDEDPKWLAKLWTRFEEVFRQALAGVRSG